ncbi:MAG: hypothetical protein Q8Q01_03415 [archaeon]|nr:hypothetical protein [archaeon]
MKITTKSWITIILALVVILITATAALSAGEIQAIQGISFTYTVDGNSIVIDEDASFFGNDAFSDVNWISVNGKTVTIVPPTLGEFDLTIMTQVVDGAGNPIGAPQQTSEVVVVNPVLDITQVKVGKANHLVSYKEGETTEAFLPGDEITFEVSVKNRLTNENYRELINKPVGPTLVHAELSASADQLGGFQFGIFNDQNGQPIFLNGDETKVFTFAYTIPLNTGEVIDNIDLSVSANDRDVPSHRYQDAFTLNVEVERNAHSFVLTEVTLEDDNTCDGNTPLSVSVFNSGLGNDEVIIRATNPSLGTSQKNVVVNYNQEKTVDFNLDLSELIGNQDIEVSVRDAAIPSIVYGSSIVQITASECNPQLRFSSVSPDPAQGVVVTEGATAVFDVNVVNAARLPTYTWTINGELQQGNGKQLTVQGNNLELDQQYTVKVEVTDGRETISQQWSLTKGIGLEVSEILFNNVNRDSDVTVDVTIRNTATTAITGLQGSFVNVPGAYNAQLVGNLPANLAAGTSVTVQVKVHVPANEAGGEHNIGYFHVESDQGEIQQAIKISTRSFLTIKKIEVNGDTNGDLTIEDLNEIEVEIQNEYNDDMEDVTVTVRILNVDGDDLEEETDKFDLNDGDKEKVTLEFDLSGETLDKDQYTIEIVVEGTAKDDSFHRTIETQIVNLDLERHGVIIQRAVLNSNILQQGSQTTMQVDIKNVGKSDEDNIEVRVRNNALGIDLKKSNIELDKFSDSNNEERVTFTIPVGSNVKAGSYPLEVEVLLDGDVVDTQTVTLTVQGENGEITTTTQDLLGKIQQGLNDGKASVGKLDSSFFSFRDSTAYIALIGVLSVLVVIAISLALVVMVTKKK